MKLPIAVLFFFSVALFTACSDKYLELDDKQNLTENTFWTTRQHALQGITASYAALQGHDGSMWTFFEEVYITLSYKADDIDNNKNEPYGKNLAAFVNSADEGGPWNLWATCYAGIGRANQVIEKVPGITAMTEKERNEIVAEAKFLRAYNYFILVNGFENVPLVLKFEKDLTKLQTPQSPAADVWAQIEKDLTEAEAVLPTAYPDAYKGRATKGAAKALLAKTYLFQEKWTAAEAKFREIYGQYTLNTNYIDNFNGTKENGPESIFEVQFSGDRSVSDERHPFNFEVRPYALDGWELFYPSDWLVTTLMKDKTATGGYSDRVYGTIFFNDPASKMWDLNIPANLVPYADVAGNLSHPAFFNKYAYPNDRGGSYVGTNISLIRYADVLLMLAEATNENGGTAAAIDLVNEVRNRSHAKPIAAGSLNKEQLREQIRNHERPVELAMEFGIRWFDLVRWGRGATAKQPVKALLTNHGKAAAANYVEDKHIRYPIPLKEINVNPLLKQNNLY
ncbi:hypothetical protein QFZ48_002891 [Chitinophaga sp. W2I13]|uniref:RagB/SusD family nutrient uptake outer membrane protein n=1 Tax=Chitinophaga sp. W2I13 TaxID=3373923 RepID=UPI003D1FFEA3